MKWLGRAWDRCWFRTFDPTSLGVFRIFLGSLLILFYLALCLNWERFYSPYGVTCSALLDPGRVGQSPWNLFYWTEGLIPVADWWWIGLLAAIGFTLGWQTRWWTVLLFALQTSINHTNGLVVNGEDLVFRMLLFYSCFAPLDAAVSVDAWLRRRCGKPDDQPYVWPVRLMQINIALIYAFSLPNKLADDVSWLDGSAIYWVAMNPTWSRFPGNPLFYWWPVSALATYVAILIEGTFPVLVWFRRPRPYVLVGITSLHLGIALMIQNVTFFTLGMACSFWVFVPGETTRRMGTWLTARGSALSRAAPPSAAAPAGDYSSSTSGSATART